MCALIVVLALAAIAVIGIAAFWRVILLAIVVAALVLLLLLVWRRFGKTR
jgi:hypothetical protein